MSPVKVFPPLSFPETRFDQVFQRSILKSKPLKWSEARRMALHRDRTCRICNADTPLTVHHMWPRGLGGGHEIENLVTLCEPCHQHLCSSCSRDESARVPGWVKPDLRRQPGKQETVSDNLERDKQEILAGIFSDAAISMPDLVPKRLIFFWEVAEPGTGIVEEQELD